MTFMTKIFAVAVLLSLCSCHRRPLEDPENSVELKILIDVDNIRNVTCGIYNPELPLPDIEPDMMHALLYDDEGRQIVAELYISGKEVNAEGRTVFRSTLQAAPGKYRLLAYNFGTEAAVVENLGSPSTAMARSTVVPDRLSKHYLGKAEGDEQVIYEPEHIMVSSEAVEIPYHTDVHTVEVRASTVVETWYVQIKVDGLQWVTGAQAFLSGMASGNFIAENNRIVDPQATVWFPMVKGTDDGDDVICAIFNTFGHVDDSDNDLSVTFSLNTTDGKTVMHEFDISQLFETENAIKHNWLLLDETIVIEEPEKKGGGFDPAVGDWEEEHRDIII